MAKIKLIVLAGKSAVGKTTLTLKLSEKLNIFRIGLDDIKERLYDNNVTSFISEDESDSISYKYVLDLVDVFLCKNKKHHC